MVVRWWRRQINKADCGAVTAEYAVVLPCVAVVAMLVLCLGRGAIVSMNCQDAAAAGARAMTIDSDGERRAVAAAKSVAGDGSMVSFTNDADAVTVIVRCPIMSDPTGLIPAQVMGKATRYY